MKIVRYEKNGLICFGLLENEIVRELTQSPFDSAWNPSNPPLNGKEESLENVKLLVPCEPTKYLALGLNYKDLAASIGEPLPKLPITFTKPISSIIATGEAIEIPQLEMLETHGEGIIFEGEVCVVIGKKGKYISKENAMEYVLGYTCSNDVTLAPVGKKDFLCCKGADTFGPIGPCIETDLIPDNIQIRSWVNDELRQDGNTKNMIFDIPNIIEYFSSYLTLNPGDVISTGTPAGDRSFKAGDTIKIEIEGIGVLENPTKMHGSIRL